MSCETDTGPIRYVDGEIAAGTTAALSLYLTDESGAALTLIDLASLSLTLVDQSTGFVINSRDAADVKNANGGVVEEVTVDGVPRLRLRMLLTVDDTEIQVAGRTQESHAALYIWTYATTHVGKVLVIFSVVSTEESAGVGPGSLPSGAPATVEYLVGALSGALSAERLVTDTATITWDLSTPGQAKANASVVGGVSSFNTRSGAVVPVAGDYAIADVTGLTAALAAKATAASVTAEAVTRAADDATLQSNITAEAGTRAAADATLQPLHANLTALSGLVGASDRAFYFTGAGALSLYTLTTFGRTLAALADGAALRTAGGLVIGTDVQAFHANLTAFAGLTLIADRLPYANGAGTLALATFTSFGRTVAALADYAALRSGAGLVIGTDVAAQGDSRFPTANEKAALAGTGTPSGSDKYVNNSDSRMTDSRGPNGTAGGSLGGTYPNPTVTKINETGGPTTLTIGAIADGQFAKRVGSTLVGAAPSATLHSAEVTRTADQTISTATVTAVTFDSEVSDTDAYHDNSTNPTRITIPTGLGGRYVVWGLFKFGISASGGRSVILLKNGSGTWIRRWSYGQGTGTFVVDIPFYIELDLVAGDYLEVSVYQNSGGNLALTRNAANEGVSPLFGVRLVV